jgi:hypothetical protein
MSACSKTGLALNDLALPEEFEDLGGLLVADLKSVIAMLAQRADERLLLTRREGRQLRAQLWNSLTEAINQAVEPLTAESR